MQRHPQPRKDSDSDQKPVKRNLKAKNAERPGHIMKIYLGLMSFLTAGEDETRAWTIRIGTKAPQAAGKIHSDFERGFIKAEVVNYKNLLEHGSLAAAREKGLVGIEGANHGKKHCPNGKVPIIIGILTCLLCHMQRHPQPRKDSDSDQKPVKL